MKPIPLEVTMMKRIGELNAERVHDLNQIGGLQEENARLKAEVERLTKAGDAMADRLMYQGYPATVSAWLAAKEGKPRD